MGGAGDDGDDWGFGGGGYLVEFELEEMKSWSLLGGGWRIDGGRGEAEFCVVGICK